MTALLRSAGPEWVVSEKVRPLSAWLPFSAKRWGAVVDAVTARRVPHGGRERHGSRWGHGAPGAVKGRCLFDQRERCLLRTTFCLRNCAYPTSSSSPAAKLMTAWADCSSDALKLYPLISRKRTPTTKPTRLLPSMKG